MRTPLLILFFFVAGAIGYAIGHSVGFSQGRVAPPVEAEEPRHPQDLAKAFDAVTADNDNLRALIDTQAKQITLLEKLVAALKAQLAEVETIILPRKP